MTRELAPMPESYNDQAMIEELEPAVTTLLEEHLKVAKPWYPHEFVPWSRGKDYLPSRDWEPQDFPLPEAARSAIFLNLLTEDNLPEYFKTIFWLTPDGHPFRDWSRRWTAEERRHSEVFGGWVHVTGAINPWELEDARMVQMSGGQTPEFDNMAEALVYTSLQEPATRIAHHNTATYLSPYDKVGQKILNRVAGDEALHHVFYRGSTSAAFEIDPSSMVVATYRQIVGFAMPGTGVPGFAEHSRIIAEAGIYDVAQFLEKIVEPTLGPKYWDLWNLEGLTPEAEAAREKLHKHLGRLTLFLSRQRERQARLAELATK